MAFNSGSQLAGAQTNGKIPTCSLKDGLDQESCYTDQSAVSASQNVYTAFMLLLQAFRSIPSIALVCFAVAITLMASWTFLVPSIEETSHTIRKRSRSLKEGVASTGSKNPEKLSKHKSSRQRKSKEL